MFIEIHDSEAGDTLLAAAYSIDYEYQAEMWVDDLVTNSSAVRLVLFYEDGTPRREWRRTKAGGSPPEQFVECSLTPGTKVDERTLKRAAEKRSTEGA